MADEFAGDLAGAEFWGADLKGATFRDVDLTGARISHAFVVDVDIDAMVDRLVVNGVDVTRYVNERDPWYPLRMMLRPADPGAMRRTWSELETRWIATLTLARSLPEATLHESVNGEWSFVQTLRHLVFAMDKWFTAPVLGEGFHPIGLPNSGSVDFPWPDLQDGLDPSFEETLAIRTDRAARFRAFLDTEPRSDFARPIDVLENVTNPLRECLFTVLEEEFWHLRYARRDLELLDASGVTGGDTPVKQSRP
jgi:hypothetical protein